MEHKRNFLLILIVIIAYLFSYLNCDTKQSEEGERYFVGKGNVTCNNKGKKNVNVTIYKKNEGNNGLDVLNSTITDTNGYFNIEGYWTISNETSTKICFKGNCSEGRKKRVGKKKNNQLCFYFPFKNITKTKDEAEKNPYKVSVPLDKLS
ncbi:Transthyretin-like family and Immunoglobulin-like fold domain-containing protein [Strongyloides ratti]|uniref:Transthyretin-like family and Immunoglobulin-like fold domain-containing protein n=1 Tax=Strongyloides ratti TaxID=34506 RepID=A0A090L2M5_STRRB|nr:Transthyretin-like family and Immunoglobulin-like fold domain-containing protein [Strongyloides ratti]CEF61684.1 Transthyretin-like family and Immunoglobulin-like fold domain-containing protein [Strongyloides ratti]